MENKPSEEELRSMLSEGQTLYQISRQFNTKIPEIFKLGRSYGISFAYDHNHIPKPTKEDLESMYHDEHLTQEQIASEFGVTQQYVQIWLRDYNISTVGHQGAKVPIPPKEVLEKMYYEDGMTQEQIAKEFVVDRGTVIIWFHKYHISTVGHQGAKVPIPPKDDILNYINEGLNQHQIAEKYEVCDWKIFDWCNHYGIPGMVNNFRCMTDEHINWRYAVFERDHRTCQKCGVTNTPMQAHHIVPYCDHPDIAYELENGITLCKECHKQTFGREYEYLDYFAAITQPHLRDHEVIESMPWEPPLPPLSDKLFPDYTQEVTAI